MDADTIYASLKTESSSSYEEDHLNRICRACLSITSTSPLPLSLHRLLQCNVIDERLPEQLCSLCISVLKRFYAFRTMCSKAENLLLEMMDKGTLTIKNIKSINRTDISYVHNLSIKHNTDILNAEDIKMPVKIENDWTDFDQESFEDLDLKKDIEIKPLETKTKKIKPKVLKKKGQKKRKEKNVSDSVKEFNEYFSRTKLSEKQLLEEFAKKKLSQNYLGYPFKCDLCYTGFASETTFDIHKEHHSEKNPYKCKICKKTYKTDRMLKKHSAFHSEVLKCKKCTYESTYRAAAVLHVRWHKGTKYDCSQCGKVFLRKSTLLTHMRLAHSSDHVCYICGYSYLGEKGVICHINKRHPNAPELPQDGPVCEMCNIKFLNEEALLTHQKVSAKHGKTKKNEPNWYKRRPRSGPDRATRDMSSHEIFDEPVECEKCGDKVYSAKQYREHFKHTHPNEESVTFKMPSKEKGVKGGVLCNVCGKTFKFPCFLKEHMTEHDSNAPEHKCDFCTKTFKNKYKLMLHRKIHTEVYLCSLCGQTFNTLANRNRHYTNAHTQGDNVKCQYCDKRFKSTAHRKVHTDHVHLNKPWPKRDRGNRKIKSEINLT